MNVLIGVKLKQKEITVFYWKVERKGTHIQANEGQMLSLLQAADDEHCSLNKPETKSTHVETGFDSMYDQSNDWTRSNLSRNSANTFEESLFFSGEDTQVTIFIEQYTLAWAKLSRDQLVREAKQMSSENVCLLTKVKHVRSIFSRCLVRNRSHCVMHTRVRAKSSFITRVSACKSSLRKETGIPGPLLWPEPERAPLTIYPGMDGKEPCRENDSVCI